MTEHAAAADARDQRTDRPRWVLLGASNVARSWPGLVALCEARSSEPPEILAALGRGRSYGAEHSFLGRQMAGIVDSGLWSALAAGGDRPTRALVTDIGNDLVYGHSPERIAGWVATCLERLAAARAEILMTRLPMASIRTISPRRFAFFRRLFFPAARVDLKSVLDSAEELDARLAALAPRLGASALEHEADWYGFDPIHIRRARCHAAWSAMLDCLPADSRRDRAVQSARLSARDRYRLLTMRPAMYRRFGREARMAQPACVLASGAVVSFY